MIRFEAGRGRTVLVCAFLFLATLAVYWPVRHYNFVEFDDPDYVFDNSVVRAGLTHWGFVWAFVDAHSANWHPLTWLSHMADCQFFGPNPGAHHLVNVMFHCANTVLLFLLLNALTAYFWRNFFVAAIFALHPLRVESVAWIAERKDVLSGFFFLLTLLFYVRHANQPKPIPPAQKKWLVIFSGGDFYKLSLFAFILGLLSKPMLVTTPFILLLLDFWPLKRFGSRKAEVGNWSLFAEKIPFFIFTVVFSVITLLVQKSGTGISPPKFAGAVFQIKSVAVNYLDYLGKIFWPRDLSILYLRPETIGNGQFVVAVIILLCILIFAVVNFQRRPYFLFGWLWFLAMLFPVSGIVQVGRQSIADRYTYLPSIGLTIALAWGFVELTAFFILQWSRQVLLVITAIVISSACVVATRHQLAFWQNTETLMGHALKIDPKNYVAYNNLAFYYLRQGKKTAATAEFKRSREFAPKR